MPDEPSNAELWRRFGYLQTEIDRRSDALAIQLASFTPQLIFEAEKRYTGQELPRIQNELQVVKSERDKLEDDFEQYQRDERDRRERDRQTRLYSAIVPVLIAVVSSAVAIRAVVAQ